MDQPRHTSKPVESTPLDTDAPMNRQVVQESDRMTGLSASNTGCHHQRLIDDVRTRSGNPTGKVRCLECGVIFDDPYRSVD
jgi:hypothetical protein